MKIKSVTITAMMLLQFLLAVPKVVAEKSPVNVINAFPKLRFQGPLFLNYPLDGTDRIFVVEQGGRIIWFENRPDVTETHVAIDIRAKVRAGGEEGLLGFAFHPKFKENHQVVLHYTAHDMPRRNVISRFKMDPKNETIDPASEEILLEVRQPWANHNGGMTAFGPDGFLYLSLGDGGSGGDPRNSGQKLDTMLGKILRIDIDHASSNGTKKYAIPKDNPFPDGATPEIYAYGLRNVWRFSFDRKTGSLWAGDVGQNLWEEIDIIRRGGNYGWRIREGMHDFNVPSGGIPAGLKLIDPVVEHHHREAISITGGYVYRGKKIPALSGRYIYGDYGSGLIWGLDAADAEAGREVKPTYLGEARAIASFGEDRDGEIYIVSLGGRIMKFVPVSDDGK